MVARARLTDESYEDYRRNLIGEAFDLKLRLRMGPMRYKAFQVWKATQTINIDEDKNERSNTID